MRETCVMIVEDDPSMILYIKNSLENLGYTLGPVASTASKAIQYAREYQPDVILMDILLEGEHDGIEAAEVIREETEIPVIFLTSTTGEAFLQRARITEPFGYLLKPFEDQLLRANIEMALYKSRMERERRKLIRELKQSLERIRELKSLIPICSSCKKIRNDQGYWEQLEAYLRTHYDVDFSHSMCPQCLKRYYPELYEEDADGWEVTNGG